MPEAEISPAGEVLVEGHHVGEMQGFRFTADRSAEGEDARAVKAAAQKALAAEFDLRADRFSGAPNGDLALGSDGILRWIGAPVATLTAGEDALKPRVVLLADEQLTGPARDKVAARAERFVNFQIESLLKPLVDLRQAEILSGIARGLAFQLVENFGLLNRRDVAEEVRSLEQEARAALRRLGVRFGAYHIFVPALIKPGPAGLATLLWALKNDARDKPGYGDVVAALAAGRTSIVTDPTFERTFYRLAGFRNLGRRAVRVDILERLADLIRPALAWRPGAGKRPDGAFDGETFIVTPAMMSILGATAEDMEAILKGLGYRAEPKPAEEVSARLEAVDRTAEAETAAKEAEERPGAEPSSAEGEPEATAGPAAEAEQKDAATREVAAGAASPAEHEAIGAQRDESAASAEGETNAGLATGVGPAQPVNVDEPQSRANEAGPSAAAEEVAASAEEEEAPKPVLVWRLARFERRRQPQRQERQDGARHGKGKPRPPRHGEEPRERKAGAKGQDGRDRQQNRQPRRDERPRREDRQPKVDPNSPFAKLAALRDQLRK